MWIIHFLLQYKECRLFTKLLWTLNVCTHLAGLAMVMKHLDGWFFCLNHPAHEMCTTLTYNAVYVYYNVY